MGLITRGSNGEGLATTGIVRNSRQAGSSILELQSTKNFVDDNEIFHFAQWTMDTTNKPVPGTLIEGTAKLISNGHISIESLDPGFTDIGSSIGDIFMIKPTTGWVNDLYGALTETLNQDGTIRDDVASGIVADKQDTLVSSVNIKTINNQSMLGSGNISTPNTTYSEITEAEIEGGNGTTLRTITARRTKKIIDTAKEGKQDTLVSGTNIRYINGYGLMGSGNVELTGEDISVSTDDASTVASAIELISTIAISLMNDKQDKLVSGQTIKTINGTSLLGAGNVDTYTKIEVDTSLAGKAEKVHVHAISDVTGLQTALDGKSATNHTHTAANVTDFDAEVSNNTDVAANTAARHTHANSAVLNATTASFTTADETKLDGIAAGATANSSDATLLARANHTGTQSADTITDGTTNKTYTATEKTKLAGIATGAQVNTVTSVNTRTGVVVLDADDISDTATTNKFVTAAEKTKLSNLSGTNTGDNLIIGTTTPTPSIGAQVLWLDTTGGNITLNLVTGE